VVLSLIAVVSLTGCGNQTNRTAQAKPTPTHQVPRIIPAIVPGSITSVIQKDLASTCTANLTPVREIMAKYKSGFAMSPAQTNDLIKLNKIAVTTCSLVDYKKWYEKEFMGWFYAKN
jgi:hypothetical protein